MKAFSPIGAAAAASIRAASLAHYQDAYIKAEAVADSALHDVADFCASMCPSDKGQVEKLSALTMIADEAEQRRNHARRRLLVEWCESVRAVRAREGTPPW